MYVSTQPYISATEAAIIRVLRVDRPTQYPKVFNEDIAELFGYIVITGTLSWNKPFYEMHFADCNFFTEMPARIWEIYTKNWSQYFLNKKFSDNTPRINGRKTLTFISIVVGGKKFLRPGNETVPRFVWKSETPVIRGFLKGVLGSSPKVIRSSGVWIAFRNPQFLNDLKKLLLEHTTAPFRTQSIFIIYSYEALEIIKEELNLHHPSWWSPSTALKLNKEYH